MSDHIIPQQNLSQQLQQVTTDLYSINPWLGLWRFSCLGFLWLSLVVLAWLTSNPMLFVTTSLLAGFVYAFWLICTHDMTHQTLTGWHWFDTILPRFMSWPMLWPYGTYASLHHLHHAWNGSDLRDPERVQWTIQEYEKAHPLLQWYVNHQWVIDIFVLGGIGLILKTFANGLRFQSFTPRLREQVWLDALGMLIIQTLFFFLAVSQGQLMRYFLFWLLLERSIGIVVQTRDHMEHYGLWGKQNNHYLTQLYNSRNLQTNSLMAWLMGGLTYHSVHHAFPKIPCYSLPEAFQRIQTVLADHNLLPMEQGEGYLKETYHLSRQPIFIPKALVSND